MSCAIVCAFMFITDAEQCRQYKTASDRRALKTQETAHAAESTATAGPSSAAVAALNE